MNNRTNEPELIPPADPSHTTAITSTPTLSNVAEPLSLLSELTSKPIPVSSIRKSDIPANFTPNFNPAITTSQQFSPLNHPFPSSFPMQSSLQVPASSDISQLKPITAPDTHSSSHSTNISETDSLDRSSSRSPMNTSTNAQSAITSSQTAHPSRTTPKLTALSSLLEVGSLPSSNLGDLRPANAPTNPFPFPFITSGSGVPFSPQAAAGMTTYYRPSPLDMTQQLLSTPPTSSQPIAKPSKKKSIAKENDSENMFDEPRSIKKKVRKTNPRGKGKTKKNGADNGNNPEENITSSTTTDKKRKKLKKDIKNNTITNDIAETKISDGTTSNTSHNLLAQMGLINNSFIQPGPPPPPPPPLKTSFSTNATNSAPNNQQQQAQITSVYSVAPHFAAYNTFSGGLNPSLTGTAYPSGYPPPYGFHPAFGTSPTSQSFPLTSSTASSITKYVVF